MPRLWHRRQSSGRSASASTVMATIDQAAAAADRVQPRLLDRHHGASARCADVSFIAKSDMAGWPVIGMLARLQRTVFVERERKRTSGEQASEIATRLADGDAMVLFAEGTHRRRQHAPAVQEHAVRRRRDGDRARARPTRSISSRWRSPTRACTACRWAAGTGRSPPGSATAIWCRICARCCAKARIDVEVHFGEPVEFTAGSSRKEVARQVEAEVRDMLQAALRNPRPAGQPALQTP